MLIIRYLVWQFFDVPGEIIRGWANFLYFNFNYFSVFTLLKTFFSHWHKYYYSYGRGWNFGRFFEAFVFNVFSRVIGAFLRTFLIAAGFITETFIIIAGFVLLIVWFVLPFLLAAGLLLGVLMVI